MKQTSERLISMVESYTEKLRLLSEDDVNHKKHPTKWSKKEYIGHLIDSATNNHQRFIRGQLYDESVFPSYDQPAWVETHNYQSFEWNELIDTWKTLNFFLSKIIGNVKPDKLGNTMTIGKTENLTLQFVIEDYLDHLEDHLKDLLI